MRKNKKDLIRFLVWLRNGFAFCTTWFLILMVARAYLFRLESVSVSSLAKMMLFVLGGVFIFNVFFTELLIKKWNFTGRLTGFMLSISIYESMVFYRFGLFVGKGSILQWLIFIGIVCGLYFCVIAIYQRYSKKQGELYTRALQKYQEQRSIGDGE